MTTSDTTAGSTDTLVNAYEELRSHVLSGSPSGRHSELALLLRQGVAAWMAGRSPCAAPDQPAAAPQPLPAAPLVSNQLHADVVRVLANMALAGRQEMRA